MGLVRQNRHRGSLGSLFEKEKSFVLRYFFLCMMFKARSLDERRRTKCMLSSPEGLWRSCSWLLISAGG